MSERFRCTVILLLTSMSAKYRIADRQLFATSKPSFVIAFSSSARAGVTLEERIWTKFAQYPQKGFPLKLL
jgi:hypothetical protein